MYIRRDTGRSGLAMIAERESYHARVFYQRWRQIAPADGAVSQSETLSFISEFADRLKNDEQTKEMLKLFQQKEQSTSSDALL